MKTLSVMKRQRSLKFTVHVNGDLTVDTGDRSIKIEREEPPAQSLYEIIKECSKLSDQWYDQEHIDRALNEPDSITRDGKHFMSKRAHDALDKEKKAYFQKLLKERYYRPAPEVKKQKVEEVQCQGCLFEAPGQRDHQGPGGCLNF